MGSVVFLDGSNFRALVRQTCYVRGGPFVMDVFCDARETMRRFEGYVVDLRRLLVFHGLACGEAQNFCDLGVKLEESRALRLDLPALLRNIRDLEQEAITAEEMLTVVALASGGDELVEGRAGATGLMRTVGLLQMMLAGVGTWAETGGVERVAQGRDAESPSEERMSFGLALEELRVQLGEVKRRVRELDLQTAMGAEQQRAVDETREGIDGVESLPADVWGHSAADNDGGGRADAAEEVEVETAITGGMGRDGDGWTPGSGTADVAREAAERAAAMKWAAAEAAVKEDERRRTWPLEERVSPLPPTVNRTAAAMTKVEGGGSPRRRMLQMGGVAAGLLLATVGIYDSLRSTPVRADRTTATPGTSATAGVASGSQASAVPEAGEILPAHDAAAPGLAAGGDRPTPAGTVAGKTPALKPALPKEAARKEVATVDVPKAAAVPVERKPVAAEVLAKNRRDDAAVEAALAVKPRTGKYVFVPAEVMEKHLLSSRRPVLPGQGDQKPAKVVLNAFIAKDGTVSRTDVVEGPPGLIKSAMAAVSWRRYRPFLLGGKPAEVVTPVTVSYGVAR